MYIYIYLHIYYIVFCMGEIKEKTFILEQVCCMENTVQWLENTVQWLANTAR